MDSCADPTVLRGQQPGDRYWYLYCTTDPLNDEDLDADGELRFHRMPMMRSRDLVNWTYLGDALPEPPAWAAEEASALGARRGLLRTVTDRYYLTFVVTDTDDSRPRRTPRLHGDSAIGVAAADGPTGPWDVSDQPVVCPGPTGPGCSFFWTFDPDVLGDTVGRESVLYYGSYYGGIYATELTLPRTAGPRRRVPSRWPIGNRYEGANVVRRGGCYYLFGSATNCCNGALTGYSVFAGRSRSPLGPFVDREGNSLLAGRVGGTPVLSMNGNRWVGTGHNTVFPDASGRWWTAYHAVDRPTPTSRPSPGSPSARRCSTPSPGPVGGPRCAAGHWASDSADAGPGGAARRPGPLPSASGARDRAG